eukprot:CAMPEP_0206163132 /NCGR_PEP_ID=MMETSP1474-20131121/11225_1 /ASSEMBLY_ACC=CAM_ASM_001110 /TAXON_ID=97495 /ORGANISM="Imantonia sp., Strain RCC918" /LENGTH=175 /DNA_ID=CAMNT_0053565563 /DNA_START=72 /DNA_END=599 /DNA_ORIENTATION=-
MVDRSYGEYYDALPQPEELELVLNKPEGGVLGLVLSDVGNGYSFLTGRAYVALVDPMGIVAKAGKVVRDGDVILSVNGVTESGGAALHQASAAELLKAASGEIKVQVLRFAGLPSGWTQINDVSHGLIYKRSKQQSRFYPLFINTTDNTEGELKPINAQQRWLDQMVKDDESDDE